VGPFHQPQGVLNIQPVIPITINDDWNLITRVITPVISQPKFSPTDHREFGLGDMNPTFFLSPAKPGEIIWGIGPTFLLPTATDNNLGNHRWGAGPGAVVLTIQGPWVVGALVNNIWSFASTGKARSLRPTGWPRAINGPCPWAGGFGRLFKLGSAHPWRICRRLPGR
jgi:hypothetical protein